MEDDLLKILDNKGLSDTLEKVGARAKLINQDLKGTGAQPDYTQDPDEMRKQGKIWDGYRWI